MQRPGEGSPFLEGAGMEEGHPGEQAGGSEPPAQTDSVQLQVSRFRPDEGPRGKRGNEETETLCGWGVATPTGTQSKTSTEHLPCASTEPLPASADAYGTTN